VRVSGAQELPNREKSSPPSPVLKWETKKSEVMRKRKERGKKWG